MRDDFITRDCRHKYDQKEAVRIAEDLAHQILTKDGVARTFALLRKTHEEKVAEIESTIRDLSRKLTDGWEYRDIQCKVIWNDPKMGEKTIVRLDTGEQIAVEAMTDEERQEVLPMEAA